MSARLAVIETHPIQYHAPLYRHLQARCGIPVTAIYGSDFSVAGYHDAEFGAAVRWDTDLLSGYDVRFLETVAGGGATSDRGVTTRGLAAALREVKPAAVLLVGYSPRFHREAIWTAWRGGYRMLLRGETTDHARSRSFLRHNARRSALRALYARFDALLYVGERSRAHMQALGVPDRRLYFSPYCVDTTAFDLRGWDVVRAATRAKYGIASGDAVFLFAGKLSARKAPDAVVRAVKAMDEGERARVVLLFLGEGEMRAELAALTETTPQVRAVWAGFQNQTQLSPYYHASDVLALPSRQGETWGLVVNEALYHGMPCVVSDQVGCAPDLITPGETGEVFPVDDIGALTRALRRTLEYAGTVETRAACMARAEAYSLARAAAGLAEAFERVITAP